MPTDEMTEILKQLAAINTKLDNMAKVNEDHEKRLRAIEAQGGKKWENLSTTILTALATAVLGYFLGQVL